jgi:hypothetical protein
MDGSIGSKSAGEDARTVRCECDDMGGFHFVEGVVGGVGCTDGGGVGVDEVDWLIPVSSCVRKCIRS